MKPRSSRRSSPSPTTSRFDLLILAAGILAATASGVSAYRLVGPYGDGPLSIGLRRAQDPDTGAHLLYRDVPWPGGAMLRYFLDPPTRRLKEVRLVQAADGTPLDVSLQKANGHFTRPGTSGRSIEWDSRNALVKVGFSLRDNGIIDAWEYRDAKGVLKKIEVSRRQDGIVDRREYYEDDQLARVEEDDTRDGRVDRWLTYDAGILIEEVLDLDGDGRPDPR